MRQWLWDSERRVGAKRCSERLGRSVKEAMGMVSEKERKPRRRRRRGSNGRLRLFAGTRERRAGGRRSEPECRRSGTHGRPCQRPVQPGSAGRRPQRVLARFRTLRRVRGCKRRTCRLAETLVLPLGTWACSIQYTVRTSARPWRTRLSGPPRTASRQ